MTEEQLTALNSFSIATRKLAGASGVKNAGGFEGDYAVAYQRLVRLGVRPQIRKKYRPR